jgi:predicted histidine transporter YuiF (NhaC family)
MDRALATVAALLVVCLLLPMAAGYAAKAIPTLASLFVLLVIAQLLWPSGRR